MLVTGGAGFLGRAVTGATSAQWECHVTERSSLAPEGIRHRCDLADTDGVRSLWEQIRPEVVVHTAYGTEHGQRDIWMATRNVVDACRTSGAFLLHMSTDLVLDGENAPYAEAAAPAPIHEYGRWKAKAERYVAEQMPEAAIVRSSLITSFTPPDPRTAWVAGALRGESPVTLFVDEIRCPILVEDLAAQIHEIVELPAEHRGGVWHLAGPEALSRFAIGALVAAALGLPATGLRPGRSSEAPSPRPRDLRLLTGRSDARLTHRARPISEAAAAALALARAAE
jgi:dTDP-4-dehydrorhamnose reductase